MGLTLVGLVLSSCSQMEDQEPDGRSSGYFLLTWLDRGTETAVPPSGDLKSGSVDFMLGDLKASREYYFLLGNGGEQDVFDISLEVDNDALTISPSKIRNLPGSAAYDPSEPTGLTPLIALGITHGTMLNGVGIASLLNMGDHDFGINITGKTLEGSDTVSIEGTFTFGVVARLMDISIEYDGSELDLTSPDGGTSTNLGGLGFMRFFDLSAEQVEVYNEGNVPIDMTVGYRNDANWTEEDFRLEVGSSCTVSLHASRSISTNYFILDGNGTITDDERIQLGNDGKGYFALRMTDNGTQPDDSSSAEKDSIP